MILRHFSAHEYIESWWSSFVNSLFAGVHFLNKYVTIEGSIEVVKARSCKRSETLFKALIFWLAGEVNWLAVEVLSPCQK